MTFASDDDGDNCPHSPMNHELFESHSQFDHAPPLKRLSDSHNNLPNLETYYAIEISKNSNDDWTSIHNVLELIHPFDVVGSGRRSTIAWTLRSSTELIIPAHSGWYWTGPSAYTLCLARAGCVRVLDGTLDWLWKAPRSSCWRARWPDMKVRLVDWVGVVGTAPSSQPPPRPVVLTTVRGRSPEGPLDLWKASP
ncbi:hypothetical protein H5410_046287 [Solanum commersonii]|uniref:Uncharacterized protein n=1 Tax=Solanum commersonii TaxID=4109 RepID=A0A9J5XDY1_SOLCO|nr:hypothetical protein H5410_046287 [Solanum commersonii]